MLPVPWRYVNSWHCSACGLCCKGYSVVLNFVEWMNVVKNYGVNFTSPGISKFYLKHRSDGSCAFLYSYYGKGFCSLQHMKPRACKLWPFKILPRPKYGRANEAVYNYAGKSFFIYADPTCRGLTWGTPTNSFLKTTLAEFLNLALGFREKQVYSTSQIAYNPQYLKPKRQEIYWILNRNPWGERCAHGGEKHNNGCVHGINEIISDSWFISYWNLEEDLEQWILIQAK